MKKNTDKVNFGKINIILKFIIFNFIVISFVFFSLNTFELGLQAISIFGAFPLYELIFEDMISSGNTYIDLFLIWTVAFFNLWFYLFVRKEKGNRKKEFIALIIYLVIMVFLWVFWLFYGGFSL